MTPTHRPSLPVRTKVAVLVILAILVAPIAVYIATFGTVISDSHIRWGEMGSAMSGIYSPLIALLALVVVIRQLQAQYRMNEHQIDVAHIEQCRADIQYYLEQLDRSLQVRDPNGSTVRQILHQHFQPKIAVELAKSELLELARVLNQQYPQPFSLWSAIYPIVAGLRAPGRFPYEHHASGSVQKIIAMTTFETCVALDNFHFCLTEDRTHIKYEFSPLFR